MDEYIKSVLDSIDHKKPNKNHQKQYAKNNNADDNFNESKSKFLEKFNKEVSEPNHSSYPNPNYEVADANRINDDDREAETRKYKPKHVIYIDDDNSYDWHISTDDQKHISINEDGSRNDYDDNRKNHMYSSDSEDARDTKLLEPVKPQHKNGYDDDKQSFFSGNGKSDIKSIEKAIAHVNGQRIDENYQNDNNLRSKINYFDKIIDKSPFFDHYSPIFSGRGRDSKNIEANEDSYHVDKSATKKQKKYKKQKKAKNKKEHKVEVAEHSIEEELDDEKVSKEINYGDKKSEHKHRAHKSNEKSYNENKENESIKASLNNNLMDIQNIMNSYDAMLSSRL